MKPHNSTRDPLTLLGAAGVTNLDKLYTQLMLGAKSTKHISDATRRRREREAATRKAMGKPGPGTVTRQRRRQEARLRAKQRLTIAKNEAPNPALVRSA